MTMGGGRLAAMRTLLSLVLGLLLVGCASSPNDPQDPQAALRELAFWTHTAAALGAQYALEENPARRPQFEAAVESLDALASSGSADALIFMSVLNTLPVKELKSKEARLAITTATLIYSRYGKEISLSQSNYVGTAIASVRDGFRLALKGTP
jgi:hypothetical protein